MGTTKNDRILLITRLVAGIIIVVLLIAFIALYIFPDHTDIDFAWTILPRTSAILMGAGYTAGAFFFARLLGIKKWHRVQTGFLPITLFTIAMLGATLLHFDRFHHAALSFYMWTGIYAITPLLVPFVWWRNQATQMHDLEENDLRFSRPVRWVLEIGAGVGLAVMLVFYIRPDLLISLAPWKLTPLTARVFCGWSMLTLASVLSIAMDGRWSAARIMLESALVGLFLTLLALPRIWPDLDLAKPMAYVFLAGLAGTLLAFIIMHMWLDRRGRKNAVVLQPGAVDG